ADAGDRGRVGQERGGEGATRVTGARMDDDAGWLVEDEDVLVLEEDGQRRGLRDELLRGGRRDVHLDPLTAPEPRRGLADRAVDADAAGPDQRLEPRARELRQPVGEPAVEPRARHGGIDGERDEPGRNGSRRHRRGADVSSPRRRLACSATPGMYATTEE